LIALGWLLTLLYSAAQTWKIKKFSHFSASSQQHYKDHYRVYSEMKIINLRATPICKNTTQKKKRSAHKSLQKELGWNNHRQSSNGMLAVKYLGLLSREKTWHQFVVTLHPSCDFTKTWHQFVVTLHPSCDL
jgi:hypothetical protein